MWNLTFLEVPLCFQGEITDILMAYISYTKKIDFPFVSRENHFEDTCHNVRNGTRNTFYNFRREIPTSNSLLHAIQLNFLNIIVSFVEVLLPTVPFVCTDVPV